MLQTFKVLKHLIYVMSGLGETIAPVPDAALEVLQWECAHPLLDVFQTLGQPVGPTFGVGVEVRPVGALQTAVCGDQSCGRSQ